LHSLSLTNNAFVSVVDQFQNATPSPWHSGLEALYLDKLEGVLPVTGNVIPTLDLGGLIGYVQGDPYHLVNGYYINPLDGTEVLIINAAPGPVPGAGLASLALLAVAGAWRRARGLLAR
jgi:hypothetical protein